MLISPGEVGEEHQDGDERGDNDGDYMSERDEEEGTEEDESIGDYHISRGC
jgi:hypothetical protein